MVATFLIFFTDRRLREAQESCLNRKGVENVLLSTLLTNAVHCVQVGQN